MKPRNQPYAPKWEQAPKWGQEEIKKRYNIPKHNVIKINILIKTVLNVSNMHLMNFINIRPG
jgi:hypothetical protein